MNIRQTIAPALVGVLLLGAAACGDDDPGAGDTNGPDTTVVDDGTNGDTGDDWADGFDTEGAREDARAVLGMDESDLDADVRVARRGDETMMLTEDYVLGRLTVELDDDGSGFRVTSVTVELPDGPETYDLEPS